MGLRIGVDLGGTNIRVALVDEKGEILALQQDTTEADKGHRHTIDKLISMIRNVSTTSTITGIGIGSPGPLDYKKGVILSPPNLPGWDSIPLVEIVREIFKVDVCLSNDANVAALAEAKIGAGVGFESVFYITVSTGIGGGFVINEQLYNGAQGYAGEIGNMILNPTEFKHKNLNSGSFEGLASGTAIARRAEALYGIQGGAKQVFLLAKLGNPDAKKIITETVDFLAMGIANIAHTINPAIFVVGGGVMNSKELILEPLRARVKEYLFPGLASAITIKPAALGGNAGVIGAAMLVE